MKTANPKPFRLHIKQGSFIAWKKARLNIYSTTGMHLKLIDVLIKLRIPKEAVALQPLYLYVSNTSPMNCPFPDTSTLNQAGKCRSDQARVLGFYSVTTGKKLPNYKNVYSSFNHEFRYTVGETVKPTGYTPFTHVDAACTSGIHWYLKKKQAKDHLF